MDQLRGLLGVGALLAIAFVLSSHKREIKLRVLIGGVLLQMVIAYLCLNFPPVVRAFTLFAQGVTKVISFANEGITFLFGSIGDPTGPWGFIFVVRVLPVIIFFAAVMSVLYHLGVMQRVIAVVAWVLRKTLGVTGVEALSASANIFVGQTEAPLTVRPYIAGMTKSQLMAVMTGGFATIAGSVLAAYVGILGGESDESKVMFAKHLMTASVMSAPAGFVMAKIMLPEMETPRHETLDTLLQDKPTSVNVVDAAASGATDGMRLAANVAAMLVAFVALLAMVNWPLTALSEINAVATWRAKHEVPVLTLQNMLGYVFTPISWLIGAGPGDSRAFGSLLGQQIIATEFVAYLDLAKHIKEGTMSPRSCQIAAYALCGFANLPSIAIQIGGLAALAPERRGDLARIAPRAMVAGALACWMTAAMASVFIPAG